jgi:hypothetical protein
MMYITTYTIILTYQIPQEDLGKFGYKLDMEVKKLLFFNILATY